MSTNEGTVSMTTTETTALPKKRRPRSAITSGHDARMRVGTAGRLALDWRREVDLDTVIAWYLADALQTGDNKVILNAISTAA